MGFSRNDRKEMRDKGGQRYRPTQAGSDPRVIGAHGHKAGPEAARNMDPDTVLRQGSVQGPRPSPTEPGERNRGHHGGPAANESEEGGGRKDSAA